MSLIVVTYSNMSEGLQEQKHLKDSCCNHQILPPNERQLKNLETWRTMYILQAAQQIILSRWVYWSKPLWGSWAGFCFFQEAGLLLVFSLQLCSSDSLLCSLAYLRVTLSRLYYTHWDWTESDKFQGLLEFLAFCIIKELSCRTGCFSHWGNCYTTTNNTKNQHNGHN